MLKNGLVCTAYFFQKLDLSENYVHLNVLEPDIDIVAENVNNSDKRPPVLKQEAMTPMQIRGTPGSVQMTDVRHAPPSVSAVPAHMAHQMQGSRGKIGRGDLFVVVTYKSSTFGPICAKDEAEVRAINALITSKAEEREYRDSHGGRRSSGVYATAAVSFEYFT